MHIETILAFIAIVLLVEFALRRMMVSTLVAEVASSFSKVFAISDVVALSIRRL